MIDRQLNLAVWPLSHGEMRLTWPYDITPDDADELIEVLDHQIQSIKRRTNKQRDAVAGRPMDSNAQTHGPI